MLHKSTRNKALLALGIVALATAAYYGGQYRYPVQFGELQQKWTLWRRGVAHADLDGLSVYRANHCPTQKRTTANCTCVALIHGLGDSALTWRKILSEPAASWQDPVDLYAIDLPGFGDSPAPADKADYRIRRMAARVSQAFSKSPDCRQWMVVGNSMGGWVAAWLAIESGNRVSKLVLVDSAGLKDTSGKAPNSLLSNPSVESLKEFQRRAYHKPRDLPDFVWKAAAERAQNGVSKDIFAAQTPEDYLDTYLPSLRKPTLVFWGESDQITPVENGRRIVSMIPGAVYRGANECGHLPQKECPAPLLHALNEMVRFGTF